MTYIALIPAYKPSACLPELLGQLQTLRFQLIVVDDGSGPDYKDIFLKCNHYAKVLTHKQNAGKGVSLKTGLNYIASLCSKETIIVTVDADGQHKPCDALAVCRLAERNPGALVLGSRRLNAGVPLRSKFGNSVTRFVYRLSTKRNIYDTQTGLRAFSEDLIPELLQISGERYEYEMNVLLQFARRHIPILEHEIETVYLDHNASSHFNALRDSLRIYKGIIRFSASSLVGFLVDYIAYGLLLHLGLRLTLSNIVARVLSASTNFTLNRLLVFQSREPLLKSLIKYILLAASILAGNTLVLNLLVNHFGIHQLLAKGLTELAFFIFSWIIQKTFIFKNRGDNP